MADKQSQKAGDNATQNQASRDIIINEAPVEFITQLIDAKLESVRKDTELAQALSDQRLSTFIALATKGLIPLAGSPVFKDPDFQMNITEAGRSATRTDSEADYDLLATILKERAKTQATPRHKMATRRAIEIVGQVSDADLASLSLVWASLRLSPIEYTLEAILYRTNFEVGQLTPDALQSTTSWIDDLATLDCVIPSSSQYFLSYAQLFTKKYPGFFCVGMDLGEANIAKKRLRRIHKDFAALVIKHPISEDRYTLIGIDEESFRNLVVTHRGKPLTDNMARVLDSVVELNKYSQIIPDALQKANEVINKQPALKMINEWWGDNKITFLRLTAVGTVIAYTNYRKLNPQVTMPSLSDCLKD